MQLIFNLKRKLAGFLPLMLLLLLCPAVSAEAAIQHNQTGLTPVTESADCMENGKLHHPEKGREGRIALIRNSLNATCLYTSLARLNLHRRKLRTSFPYSLK